MLAEFFFSHNADHFIHLLQVAWDEPDLLQNVKRVSPWLVELVSNMPAIHLSPFSPPRKKLCVPMYPELPLEGQFPTPMFHGSPLGRGVGPMCYFPDGTPAGIQGARHAQFGISLSDLHLNKLQSLSVSPRGIHQLDHGMPPRIAAGLIIGHRQLEMTSPACSPSAPHRTRSRMPRRRRRRS